MKQNIAKLESFILDKMVQSKLPGLSMVLINKEDLGYRNFGFKDLVSRAPPTSKTLFGLGSITKVFTAVAIMQLRDKGAVQLDDPVSQYVAGAFADLSEPVLIKHLLSHSSGLPALGFSESKMSERWWMDGHPISSLDDILSFMRGADSWMHSKPGRRWFYLNEGYLLLGAIIERVTGQTYQDYIREHVLYPLGMQRSFFTRDEVEPDPDKATPYMQDRSGELFIGSNLYSELPAAGGLVSTASDMAKFAHMFLQRGQLDNGDSFLSQESISLMSDPVIPLPPQPLAEQQDIQKQLGFNGLGLVRQQGFFEHDVLGHGGGVMGGTSYLAFIPEAQIAVILLSNAHGYPMFQLAVASLAALLKQDLNSLSFIRFEKILLALEGDYASFKKTIQAKVRRHGGGLELRLCFKHEERILSLFPGYLGEQHCHFKSYSNGRQSDVEFHLRANQIELIYERYSFRKS